MIGKNNRGFSPATFRFMRGIIMPTMRYYCAPKHIRPENMPQGGPCFIFANHSNYYDPFLLNDRLTEEPTSGVMTRFQFYKPAPRFFMGSIGIVPTSKYLPEPMVIRQVLQMIDQKRMIVIFPEGGRRWDGKPKSVIEATFKMYWKFRIPVHPVQLHGSWLGWPRWADYARRSRMEVHWLPPLQAADFSTFEEFRAACLETMNYDEYKAPENTRPFKAKKPASGIHRLLYRCPLTGEYGAVHSPDGYKIESKTSSEFRFSMSNDSRLIDKEGKRHSLISSYETIKRLPLWRDHNGFVIPPTPCLLYRENKKRLLDKVSKAQIALTTEDLVVNWKSEKIAVLLDKLTVFSIEQNNWLMFYYEKQTWLADIGNHSALMWQDVLRRLQKGEQTERKN